MAAEQHDDDLLLAEQQEYYRRRAPTYDDWWQRRGRYESGPAHRVEWDRQVAAVEAALVDFGAAGDVLELAGGTGWWTQRLATTASTLTVVDGSPETLERNRARVGRGDVTWVVADLFSWTPPPAAFDVVFSSFWISHVPRSRAADHWRTVASALRPGGRAFFLDNRHDPTRAERDPYVLDHVDDVHRRTLDDGTEHRVVKVFYEPDELTELLAGLGWQAHVTGTPWFVHGWAAPPAT